LRILPCLLALLSTTAFAGSMSRDCETADKSIVMGAGNSTGTVQIKFIDENGKPGVLEAPIALLPDYGDNTDDAKTIFAVPTSVERVVLRDRRHMHVVHEDGSQCDGRESWDDRSVQTYVLMGQHSETLSGLFLGKKVKNLTPSGYLQAEFRCHDYGITTPGGCFVEGDKDKVTWVKDK
jgi:hypothetical protein